MPPLDDYRRMRPPRRRLLVGLVVLLGVIAVVAGVGIVTEAQGDLFWLDGQPTPGCAAGPPSGLGGTPTAFSRPTEQSNDAHHWYNFSVQSAEGGEEWDEVKFQVVTFTGTNVTPAEDWTLGVMGTSGEPVASYLFAIESWSTGGTAPITSAQTVVLDTGPASLSSVGDALDFVATTGCFQGSLEVSIP
jgi:hypothetical protein